MSSSWLSSRPPLPLLSPCKNAQAEEGDGFNQWVGVTRQGRGTHSNGTHVHAGGSHRNERATGEREKRTNFRLMKMKAAPVELRAPIKSKNEGGRGRTCTAYGCMKLLVTPSPVKTPILPRRTKGRTTCAKSAPPLFLGRSA